MGKFIGILILILIVVAIVLSILYFTNGWPALEKFFDGIFNSHVHNYTEYVKYNDVQHEGICSCGEKILEMHRWDSGTIKKESTCVETGIIEYKCTSCGISKSEISKKNPLNHVNIVSIPAVSGKDCTKPGYTAGVYCNDCNNYISGHELTYTHIYNNNWVSDGSYTHSQLCTVCKSNESKISESHNWNGGSVTIVPTCVSKGEKIYTCYTCNATKKETLNIDSYNHVHTHKVEEIAPTNTSQGYTAGVYCDDCYKYISGHELITKINLNENPVGYYSSAWKKTENLNSYNSSFNIDINAFLKKINVSGSAKATNQLSNPWFEGTLSIDGKETKVSNSTGIITANNKKTGTQKKINFFKFGSNLIKKTNDSLIRKAVISDNCLTIDLNESESKYLFGDFIDFASVYGIDLNEYNIKSTNVAIRFKDGYIYKYEFNVKLTSGISTINIKGEAVITP